MQYEYPELIQWITHDLTYDEEGLLKKINNLLISVDDETSNKFDCLYYLAWNGVAPEKKNDLDIQVSNLYMAKNTMWICEQLECGKFINLGTVAEYVSCKGLINDDAPSSPADIYGALKIAARNVLEVEASKRGIIFINTILSSVYGEYRHDNNVITYTIKSLLSGKRPQYGPLNQMWDFLYIEDAVMALYLIGEKGIAGETYSIGSGSYRHLYTYVKIIRDLIDPTLDIGINELGSKYKAVLNSCVDTYKLQRDTDFYPRYSFEEGIAKTIEYFRGSVHE